MKAFLFRHCRAAARHCGAQRRPSLHGSAVLVFAFCALAPLANAQNAAQPIELARGWNAVYIEVSPEASPDALFANWPVDSVGVYDPAAFLSTRQFSATTDTQGIGTSPIAMWRRGIPDASPVSRIPAGVVCIAFNTGGVFRTTLIGVPAAPRTTWHVTDDNTVYNFFGFSVQGGATVKPDDYLAGFSGAAGTGRTCWMIGGLSRGASPTLVRGNTGTAVADGAVLLLPSSEVSDWSGALHVSPMDGLDFGTNATRRTLEIRNDGAAPRTVSLEINRAVAELSASFSFDPTLVHWRDADIALTNATWNALSGFGEIAHKTLGIGETWRIQIGLDRAALPSGLVKGTPFGALLTARDIDGGSKMKAVVPIRAAVGGTGDDATWPAGLWVADVALKTVDFSTAENPAPAGCQLKLRLLVHVAADGTIRLLQRVIAAGEADADGTLTYRLYAGPAEPPATATQALRISSAVLPTEKPVIAATTSSLTSLFGFATFSFTIEANGATSLLRHPYHPQHDGLRWDFSTSAPPGDNLDNYKGEVKPELFSVKNSILLMLDFAEGAARWDPQETVTGTCAWSFEGLRHEGNLVASGPMTLRRVSQITELILE